MIRLYQEFDTEADAIAWREAMYRSYHPLGYSTHIRIEQMTTMPPAPQRWVAYGSRAESCD